MLMHKRRHENVIATAAADVHVKGHGKNFKPLISAGSWVISDFHYGRSKCACCGRPITRVLHLKNESHDVNALFPETIEIGMTCGPKVFIESCIGFYSDPQREWERQHKAWKDYINYVILCVKHKKLWDHVPDEFRTKIDAFLQEGYKSQDHTGGWWMVRDAKKSFLRCQRNPDVIPDPRVLFSASRNLLVAARRQGLVPQNCDLLCDRVTGTFSMSTGT